MSICTFYFSKLDDHLLKEATEPHLLPGQTINGVEEWAKDYVNQARDRTLGYFIQNMLFTIQRSGGAQVWATTSVQQHGHVVSAMFDEHHFYISTLAFKYEIAAVNFGSIFARDDSVRFP